MTCCTSLEIWPNREIFFFSGLITSNVTQIHYHSEGKVKRKLQYVPENYLSPFLVARVSEESRWELKCRENRLVTAFKTRQKFHFRDIPFTKLKSHTLQQHLWQPHFRATIGQIAWKPGVEFFSKGKLSEENLLVCFQIGRQHHVNKKQGRGTVRRRIHFLQSLICFSTKTAFQNKLRFLRQRNDPGLVRVTYHHQDENTLWRAFSSFCFVCKSPES